MLPVIEALLRRARAASARATELEGQMQALQQQIFMAGGTHVDISAAAKRRGKRDKAVQEAKDTIAEIESIGAVIEDMQAGALGFPCVIENDVVLLSWKMGETAIAFWHAEGAEFTDRQPIDHRFQKNEKPH